MTMFSRRNVSWSHMEMKSPEVSFCFAFCSSVNLCSRNREQIFRLPKSSRTMLCAVSLIMPNSSAINFSVSRRSCASICHTFSIISGVLFVDGRPERGSFSVVFVSSRKRLNHSQTYFLLSSSLPQTCTNISRFSVAVFPNL